MPQYEARVFGPDGVSVRYVEASERATVAATLGVRPQRVLSARELTQLDSKSSGSVALFGRTKRFPMQLFSHELAVLLDAGIPLLEALSTLLEKEGDPTVRRSLSIMVSHLKDGLSLSAAMRAQPRVFDELVCAIVSASERTGQLGVSLAQHSRYLAWIATLRARLVAACVYPAMLLALSGAVVLFLLTIVLPRFSGIAIGLNTQLPWSSRLLFEFSQRAGDHPVLVLAIALLVVTLGVALFRLAPFREFMATKLLTLPGLGPRLRVLALARLYRSLGMLVASGVPMMMAMCIVVDVVAAPWRSALLGAAARVERGERLSHALDEERLATPVALRMVRVGERSGELAVMLERAASFHDDEVTRSIELFSRAINPALMLLMAVLIGGIIVLMYLPIFQLVEHVQ